MTVDVALVTRKLLLVARDLDMLSTIQRRGSDAYLVNTVDQAVAERHLERMIGRMIDANYHLLTESGAAPPPDYHASFLELAMLGVLDPSFAKRLAASAGLRNRIVHEYDALDHRRVFEALSAALTDIPAYIAAVDRYLSRIESR